MTRQVTVKAPGTIPAGRRLTDLVVLVRLPSCIAGGASVLLGIHLATGSILPARLTDILAILGMFLAVAAANVINDILDIDVDALDKPRRPLPSGRLSFRSASALAATLGLAAVVSAVPLGLEITLWMIALLALAAGYSLRFKNTVLLGNIVVALCASSPIAFGAAVSRSFDAPVWLAVGLAFSFMLAYETLKTIADRDSDAAAGLRTFATEMGVRASIYLFRFLIVILTAAACSACIVSSRPGLYLVAVLGTFVLPAWSAMIVLGGSPDEKPIRAGVFLMRIAWFLGIVALWLLR